MKTRPRLQNLRPRLPLHSDSRARHGIDAYDSGQHRIPQFTPPKPKKPRFAVAPDIIMTRTVNKIRAGGEVNNLEDLHSTILALARRNDDQAFGIQGLQAALKIWSEKEKVASKARWQKELPLKRRRL